MRYRYVGPQEIRDQPAGTTATDIHSAADLDMRPGTTVTFVVTLAGTLRVAPRRSEHVACAAGQDILAAGEMTFDKGPVWSVTEVTNQSTGYCPDPDCWPAVTEALTRAGIPHPPGFTSRIIFRLCPTCGERNIIRDGDFTCALCDHPLPQQWNFPTR